MSEDTFYFHPPALYILSYKVGCYLLSVVKNGTDGSVRVFDQTNAVQIEDHINKYGRGKVVLCWENEKDVKPLSVHHFAHINTRKCFQLITPEMIESAGKTSEDLLVSLYCQNTHFFKRSDLNLSANRKDITRMLSQDSMVSAVDAALCQMTMLSALYADLMEYKEHAFRLGSKEFVLTSPFEVIENYEELPTLERSTKDKTWP